ncbi:hypothetical protein SPONL_359 [uncultured Candidatus Thioglobus sp.]|nr:hypothetical protein SPONL_359 [uncultured Candidatus Thioglobus sp.]
MNHERENIIIRVKEARKAGARQTQACGAIGISAKNISTLGKSRQPVGWALRCPPYAKQ